MMKHYIKIITVITMLAMIFATSCKKDEPVVPQTGPVYGSFTDPRDNQVYTTVELGIQTWFAENLNYYTDSSSWCYGNDSANGDVYGRLYTWDMANDACPDGWHLPDKDEWNILVYDYLGGFEIAGGKLKKTDTLYWESPNYGATNSSGFAALPGGYYSYTYSFTELGNIGTFWSSDENDSITAYKYDLSYNSAQIHTCYDYKWTGKSVRCVKD